MSRQWNTDCGEHGEYVSRGKLYVVGGTQYSGNLSVVGRKKLALGSWKIHQRRLDQLSRMETSWRRSRT